MNGQLKEIRHLRGIIGGLMSDIDAHKKLIREIKNIANAHKGNLDPDCAMKSVIKINDKIEAFSSSATNAQRDR